MIDPHDMVCQELVEVLTEYLDGTLGAHDRARLEAHLRSATTARSTWISSRRRSRSRTRPNRRN